MAVHKFTAMLTSYSAARTRNGGSYLPTMYAEAYIKYVVGTAAVWDLTDRKPRDVPDVTGEYDEVYCETRIAEIANLLYSGLERSALDFVRAVRRLQDLADGVTDHDLAALFVWLEPLLDKTRRDPSAGDASSKLTHIASLLFPYSPRQSADVDAWIFHITRLHMLAVVSHGGNMSAALAWVEAAYPLANDAELPDMAVLETHLVQSTRKRISRVPSSGPMSGDEGRPSSVTATATTAAIRGQKPPRPLRTHRRSTDDLVSTP
jgi:hypothetical protein